MQGTLKDFMRRMDEQEKVIQKQQESINKTKEMLQLLVKGKIKKKSESSFNKRESFFYNTPKKDKEKKKENEPRTPSGSANGKDHYPQDNHFEFSNQ